MPVKPSVLLLKTPTTLYKNGNVHLFDLNVLLILVNKLTYLLTQCFGEYFFTMWRNGVRQENNISLQIFR